MEYVLPTHYFHVVFTLPHELVPLALRNRKAIFDLLFSAAARTLLELGKDEQRLGAQLGGSCPYSCVEAVFLGRQEGRESLRVVTPRSLSREATNTIPST
jgi:hypothetical protein